MILTLITILYILPIIAAFLLKRDEKFKPLGLLLWPLMFLVAPFFLIKFLLNFKFFKIKDLSLSRKDIEDKKDIKELIYYRFFNDKEKMLKVKRYNVLIPSIGLYIRIDSFDEIGNPDILLKFNSFVKFDNKTEFKNSQKSNSIIHKFNL